MEDEADVRETPSGDHRVVEPDAARLVWVLQIQSQDDVRVSRRLYTNEAAKHPPQMTGPGRTRPRRGSSSLVECLRCRTGSV